MRRTVGTHLTILTLAALAVAGCAKDPTEGKATATVAAPQAEKAAPAPAAPAAVTEVLDVSTEGSKIGFVGAKVTAQHVGAFKSFTGKVSLADGKIEGGKVEFEVKTADMVVDDGKAPKLEGHLKSPDFFDVEKFPTARFVSTAIKAGSDQPDMTHTVTGDFEIRGVKRTVTFPAQIEVGAAGVTAKTEFGINRKDFGIEYAGMPDDLIKDNVLITVQFTAPRGATADKQ